MQFLCPGNFRILATPLCLTTISGYHGCKQPEETVVLGGLLWDSRLIVKQLGPDYLTGITTIIMQILTTVMESRTCCHQGMPYASITEWILMWCTVRYDWWLHPSISTQSMCWEESTTYSWLDVLEWLHIWSILADCADCNSGVQTLRADAGLLWPSNFKSTLYMIVC